MAEIGVKLITPWTAQNGLGQCGRSVALALSEIGIAVNLVNIPNFCKVNASLPEETMTRLKIMEQTPLSGKYVAIHYYPAELLRSVDSSALANISYTVYETNKIPLIWKLILNNDLVNEVWTASEFNKKTFIESGVAAKKVSVINQGVNTNIYHLGLQPLEGIKEVDSFYFLFVSALKHCKGFDFLLQAFFEEFKNEKRAKLLFKADLHSGDYGKEKEAITNMIKQFKGNSLAEVMVVCENLNEDVMARLYSTADCFVLPTRGEGWGLGTIQSMACGVPAITTEGSGHMEFCNSKNTLLVPAKYEQIVNLEWLMQVPLQSYHDWLTPDFTVLKRQMRWAFENKNLLKEIGKQASEDVQKFSWDNTAMAIVEKISKYA